MSKSSRSITAHGPRKPHRKSNSGPWRAPSPKRLRVLVVHKIAWASVRTRCKRWPDEVVVATSLPRGKGYKARWCRKCVPRPRRERDK